MRDLFRHSHAELTGPVEVTGARVDGNQAYVLLGSTSKAVSFIGLLRERGAWKVNELIGTPLP